MKNLIYIPFGVVFSIILIKSEAISWFRIQEMFYFESFHMYGLLMSGITVALFGIQILKFRNKQLNEGCQIQITPKAIQPKANIAGGILFGLGWGITGACTGPIFSLIGVHVWPAFVILFGALAGTLIYAFFKDRLPH